MQTVTVGQLEGEIQVQPGYEDAGWIICRLWDEDVMVCCNDIGIEDKPMKCSSFYCQIKEKEQHDQKYTSQCKWNKQSQVTVATFLALGTAQDKTETFFALSTQQARMAVFALLIWVVQVDILTQQSSSGQKG